VTISEADNCTNQRQYFFKWSIYVVMSVTDVK
jgi:hypothetical protein